MARLAAANLSATVDTALYTVPVNTRTTLSLSLCNRDAAQVQVRIAITTGSAPTNADYLDYDLPLNGNDSYERSGIILTAAQVLYVRTSIATVSAVCWGVEEQQ